MLIHPIARDLAERLKIDETHAIEAVYNVGREIPNFLVGGYLIDIGIVAMYHMLVEETDQGGVRLYTRRDIVRRIAKAMEVAYA